MTKVMVLSVHVFREHIHIMHTHVTMHPSYASDVWRLYNLHLTSFTCTSVLATMER